ncbi:MAG: aminotransferase class V-fold PLP-dependent enzyme [Ignavibacteria bacterium]|nr:aminotransferase class V-fold PLP-dependent enzyme [Ignavibacteria bacterium]
MDKKYFTVGPTEMFPEIGEYFAEAFRQKLFSVSHRSKEFEKICADTNSALRKLMNIPDDFYVFFLSSATECMERSIENLVEKKSFHFINGFFAQRYYDVALQLKKESAFVKSDYGRGFDFANSVIPSDTEMICITHNETSTGIALPLNYVYDLKKKHPGKILSLDIVTSVPYYDIDFNFVDVAFFSVQKGFGLPPGLGVMVCKKNLVEKTKLLQEKNINIGTYNNFLKLARNADKNQTTMTPNIPAIFLLGKSCELILQKDIGNVRNETDKKANLLYGFFDKHDTIKPFVKDTNLRSKTTLVLETELDVNKIFEKVEYNGFVLSRGYGDFKDKHIRIGNFPVHKFEDVSNLIYLFRKF